MEWLQLRKRADKSGAESDLSAGESWPLAGVELIGKAPKNAELSTGYVVQGQSEGWIELKGMRLAEDAAGVHVHADAIVLKLAGGDVRYKVVENPGWIEDPDAPGGHRVEHRFLLRHVSGGRD